MLERIVGSISLGGFAILAAAGLAAAQDVGVLVETSRSLYEPGETVQVTVTNQRPSAIFLAGCGAVVAEALADERYLPVPGPPCVTEGRAVKVEAGATQTFDLPEAGKSGDVRRLSVGFGWGCEEARPLTQARCTEFATAVSTSYRVGRRNEK